MTQFRLGAFLGRNLRGTMAAVFFDAFVWVVALVLATGFRFGFLIEVPNLYHYALLAAGCAVISLTVGLITGLYRNRFITGSLEELIALVASASGTGFVAAGLVLLFAGSTRIALSIPALSAILFLVIGGGGRLFVRWLRALESSRNSTLPRAIVYGSDDGAQEVIRQLQASKNPMFQLVGFTDENPQRQNLQIRGLDNFGALNQLGGASASSELSALIVPFSEHLADAIPEIHALAHAIGLEVFVGQGVQKYSGELNGESSDFRTLTIEDVVGRKTVNFTSPTLSSFLRGKTVMVTGSGGSIGSELARQIADLGPARVVLLDRDDSLLKSSEEAMTELGADFTVSGCLVDVRDSEAVSQVFQAHRPQVVFHAAALKHVSALEKFPSEAWKTNVVGTLNVLQHAADTGCETFVNISTDKAANPVSFLGRSKKLAEELTCWFSEDLNRQYVSVRFGNVLGSRGSLVPLVSERITRGLPVRVTHEDATRFFMSVSEAAQLVLQGASDADPGEVLILDMGDPIKVKDIVAKLIKLSGREVEIVYTGLGPGEKLHEELVTADEDQLPQTHPAVFRIRGKATSPGEVLAQEW